jgi:Domain of unknown function (DUF4404)
MPRARLSELLEQLQQELQAAESLDEAGREGLEGLRDEIRERLARDDDAELLDLSLVQRLEHAIGEFEIRHPDLTIQLKTLVDAFRALGFR